MMVYNWQLPNWANFSYDSNAIEPIAMKFALEIGEITGLINSLSDELKETAIVDFMIAEAMKTSEIEGEFFSRIEVQSSIKKQLGIADDYKKGINKKAKAAGSLIVTVRKSYKKPLTIAEILNWHKILMSGYSNLSIGKFRTSNEPMQIVSGAIGKEQIHFEAPPAAAVPQEMENFIKWYNDFEVAPTDIKNMLIKTSIAHLYFESIHPFGDGNGRIGRAIAEKTLSQTLNRPVAMSLSNSINLNKKKYYDSFKPTQQSLEVTDWIIYFSETILEAQQHAKQIIGFVLQKTKFLDAYKSQLNVKQLKAILKMFDAGKNGFEGGMTTKKYISINKTSRATASRDLLDLFSKNIFIQNGKGRNVNYSLNL